MTNNAKEKYMNKNISINNNNCWSLSKCKYELDNQMIKIHFDFDIKIEINKGTILIMGDYLGKKGKNNNFNINDKEINKELIQDNINDKNITNKNIVNDKINNNYEKLKNKDIKNNNDINV